MFASENIPRMSQPTTTDRYHHRETIWRILIDAISLIICMTMMEMMRTNEHCLF